MLQIASYGTECFNTPDHDLSKPLVLTIDPTISTILTEQFLLVVDLISLCHRIQERGVRTGRGGVGANEAHWGGGGVGAIKVLRGFGAGCWNTGMSICSL